MVSAYLETLIEQLTGTEKAVPDQDGDYSISYRGARYWARVEGEANPIVRIYSIVLAQLEPTPELYESLNVINTRMTFLRAFWVDSTVIFEHEHVGHSMQEDEFTNSFTTIASATDFFGPQLHERFGGVAAFHESKTDDYATAEIHQPGYL